MKKWIIGIMVIFAFNNNVQAAPSVYGSTGMINTPTADVTRAGQFYLGYYHLNEGKGISFGTNLAKDFEISLAALDYDENDSQAYLNLKYSLKQENILTPGIAVGIEDIAGEDERTIYASLSKALPFGIRVHAGYGNGRYDGLFYAIEKQIMPSVAAGVFPDTSLIIEHDGHDFNYGLRMSLISGLKINAGWRDDETYWGLTYNFY